MRSLLALLLLLAAGLSPALTPVEIPGGNGGVGFDDLGYAPDLGRVLVPAGRTGSLDWIDPVSLRVTPSPASGPRRATTEATTRGRPRPTRERASCSRRTAPGGGSTWSTPAGGPS